MHSFRRNGVPTSVEKEKMTLINCYTFTNHESKKIYGILCAVDGKVHIKKFQFNMNTCQLHNKCLELLHVMCKNKSTLYSKWFEPGSNSRIM